MTKKCFYGILMTKKNEMRKCKMTTVIVVRHGQSVCNLSRVFTGQSDISLSELGFAQAELTGEYLKKYPIDRIYSSPLLRAHQTAEPTARNFGLPIEHEMGIQEIDLGEWEGIPFDDVAERFKEDFQLWHDDLGRSRPTGGESVVEVGNRVYAAIDRLVAENSGRCIALFTHSVPIRTLITRWNGYGPEDTHKGTPETPRNCGVTVAYFNDDGTFDRVEYNHYAHLEAMITESYDPIA